MIPPLMTMEGQRSSIFTLDLLSGVATDQPSQSSPEALDLSLPPTTELQLGLPGRQPTAVFRQINYPSVCTLDNVRSALERFETGRKKRRSTDGGSNITTTTSLSTISSSLVKELGGSVEGEDEESYESPSVIDTSLMALAGCRRCLVYVLVSKGNPSCPRCGSDVPVSSVLDQSKKRTRIDLN